MAERAHDLELLKQPLMFLFDDAVRPRVVVEVADHPAEIHGISWCGGLWMVESTRDGDIAVMFDTISILANHGTAKPLRFIKTIIVDLGLIMMVWRIAGPASGIRNYFTNH